MKEACEFVKHTIFSRKFDEQLSQTHLFNKTIQTCNGVVTSSHPFPKIKNISVDNVRLLKALQATDYKGQIKVTENNIIVTGDGFRTLLPYTKNILRMDPVKGKKVDLPEDFVEKIKKLYPLISEDASREWSQSILVNKGRAYITNNILVGRLDFECPNCALPVELLSVVLRIKDTPKTITIGEKAIQIDYGKKRWIQCLLKRTEWPNVKAIFKIKGKPKKIPQAFIDAVQTIAPFVDEDLIVVKDNNLISGDTVIKEVGVANCCISLAHTLKMVDMFTHADFSNTVMLLKGEGIQGAFAQRVENA